MKTLKVTLKQHTPLIHFQHDQYGATLRASEVKPKLDRFILTKLGGGNYKAGIQKAKEKNGWLVGKGEHPALNYKMKIMADSLDDSFKLEEKDSKQKKDKQTGKITTVFSLEDFPMLLSNMGGKENKNDLMNFSYSSSELYVTIDFFSVKKNGNVEKYDLVDLYDIVKHDIIYFFANQNFGQRSTKGFGSFTVIKIDDKPIKWDNNIVYENDTKLMRYAVEELDFDTVKNIFEVIDFYWKSLKSGINCTKRVIDRNGNVERRNSERYIKAFLWTYLNDKNKTWEKRLIKNALSLECKRAEEDKAIIDNNNPAFFARAHLGCPINGFTYRIPQSRLVEVRGRYKEDAKSVEVKISNDREKEIERIASPIIFKPVYHTIIDKETQKAKNVISIYILYDKNQIVSLYQASETRFTFKGNYKTTSLPLFVKDNGKRFEIDFHDLISEFHKSLGFILIPRDFNWNRILEGNVVKLLKTVKK